MYLRNEGVKLLLALLSAALLPAAHAQDVWIKQSPFPTDRSLTGVAGFSADRFFVCGLNRTLLETVDGGSHWQVHFQSTYGTDPFYDVAFFGTSLGLVVGNNNDAWRTLNSGASWTQTTSLPAGSWYHIDFVSSNAVFVGANGGLAMSVDGGATWTLKSGYPNCPVVFGMDFLDTSVGLVCGNQVSTQQTGIFKTVNGGQTWQRKYAGSMNAVRWMSNQRAVAAGGTTVVHTLDGGETWQPIFSGLTTGVVSMARAGTTSVLVAVSGKGDIWRSPDGGFSWTMVLDGPGALPAEWEVSFANATDGWVVGDQGFIFATADGGLTWRQVNVGCGAQIQDLQMFDSSFGMAVGHDGYLFRTENGGAFWEVQKLEVTGQVFGRTEDLVAIDIVDRQFAVVAGPGGTVFKTQDGGSSWVSIGYPNLSGNFRIQDVDFVDHNVGYLYGFNDDLGQDALNLFRTTDGGATWTVVNHGQVGGGTTLQFVDALYGWISSINRFGQRTRDGGATWTSFQLPAYFVGPTVQKVEFYDRNVGWAAGWDGYLAKTLDGGETWTLVDLGTTEDILFDISIVSPNEVWLCGREAQSFDGVVYHTTNGGLTWTRQVVQPYPTYPYRISALPSGHVWFGGYGGSIHKRFVPSQTVLPTGYSIVFGFPTAGNLQSLLQSDDDHLRIMADFRTSRQDDPVTLEVQTASPTATPSGIEFVVESHTTYPGIEQRVALWDFSAARWEQVYAGPANTADTTITVAATGNMSRFLEPGTRNMKARLSWRPVALNLPRSWEAWIDRAVWQITP